MPSKNLKFLEKPVLREVFTHSQKPEFIGDALNLREFERYSTLIPIEWLPVSDLLVLYFRQYLSNARKAHIIS